MTYVSSADSGCACGALRRAARSATQLYDLVLVPSGLKATQFIMLKAIEDAGEIAQCDLARENAVAVETLSRRLGALRRKGLVTARTGKNHGEQIYSLTDEGKKILETSRPYWERAQARLRRTMGEKEWQLVFELSDRIVSATQQAEEMRIVNSTAAKPDAVLLQQ